jgi:hypothetical protein
MSSYYCLCANDSTPLATKSSGGLVCQSLCPIYTPRCDWKKYLLGSNLRLQNKCMTEKKCMAKNNFPWIKKIIAWLKIFFAWLKKNNFHDWKKEIEWLKKFLHDKKKFARLNLVMSWNEFCMTITNSAWRKNIFCRTNWKKVICKTKIFIDMNNGCRKPLLGVLIKRY